MLPDCAPGCDLKEMVINSTRCTPTQPVDTVFTRERGGGRFVHLLLGCSGGRLASKIRVSRVLWMRCSPQQTLSIRARAICTVKQLKPGQPRLL